MNNMNYILTNDSVSFHTLCTTRFEAVHCAPETESLS